MLCLKFVLDSFGQPLPNNLHKKQTELRILTISDVMRSYLSYVVLKYKKNININQKTDIFKLRPYPIFNVA